MHCAAARGIEQCRGVAAMHRADRVVRMFAWHTFEGDDAVLHIDEFEIERYADARKILQQIP